MKSFLTEEWQLRFPIIGAPMSPQSGGRLAAAISLAGGLGMIGVAASQSIDQLRADADECRASGARFGIGLMTWVLEKRPSRLRMFEPPQARRQDTARQQACDQNRQQ